MVQPMKQNGLDDLNRLQARLRRVYALGRIGQEDFAYIDQRLNEVEERIVQMREHMPNNRRVPF